MPTDTVQSTTRVTYVVEYQVPRCDVDEAGHYIYFNDARQVIEASTDEEAQALSVGAQFRQLSDHSVDGVRAYPTRITKLLEELEGDQVMRTSFSSFSPPPSEQCPCGQPYWLAAGEKACHMLVANDSTSAGAGHFCSGCDARVHRRLTADRLGWIEQEGSTSINPGPGRGLPPQRQVLTGRRWTIRPPDHTGHTVKVGQPLKVPRAPSHRPTLCHVVRCSCGDEYVLTDEQIADFLGEPRLSRAVTPLSEPQWEERYGPFGIAAQR